jgi:hypothetical protein
VRQTVARETRQKVRGIFARENQLLREAVRRKDGSVRKTVAREWSPPERGIIAREKKTMSSAVASEKQ